MIKMTTVSLLSYQTFFFFFFCIPSTDRQSSIPKLGSIKNILDFQSKRVFLVCKSTTECLIDFLLRPSYQKNDLLTSLFQVKIYGIGMSCGNSMWQLNTTASPTAAI